MARKIKDYSLEILTLVGITLSNIFIIQCEKARFYASLYTQTNLLVAGRIYNFAQQRMFVSAMLYTLGIACILLCLVSYESREFLRCSRLFFLASGFVISIWNDEFIFYISKYNALLWSRIGDICLVSFTVCLYRILISECRPIHDYQLLKKVNFITGIIIAGSAFFLNQGQMLWFLKAYFVYSMAYSIALVGIIIREQCVKSRLSEVLNKTENLVLIVSSVFINMLIYLVAFYKFNILSKAYAFYNVMIPYILLGAVMVFFLVFIQLHRMGIVFGGEANLKLKEIERHRCNVANSLTSYFFTPINNLIFYNRKLEEFEDVGNDEIRKEIHVSVEKELYRIKRHLINMNDYQNLGDKNFISNPIKINIKSIINYAIIFTCNEFHISENTFKWKNNCTADYYINGEPYALIQVIQAVFATFYDFYEKDRDILIELTKKSNYIYLEISTTIAKKNLSLAKRAKKIMEMKERVPRLVYDEDLMLYNSQNYLNCHEAEPSMIINYGSQYTISFICKFKQWEKESPPNRLEENDSNCSEKKEKIILLSTSPEQIDIIRQYLKTEPYSLYVFNTEEDAYVFIKNTDNVGLIIIGNLFFGYTTNGICEKIRDIYPMAQLPIIVICRSDYKYIVTNILKYVNDILIEPFEQADLIQKVYLLMLLRKSAQETLKAKVDFLQSQIDPHFIFNALSSIMPLCIENPPIAYKALNDFSDYLRGRLYPKELQNPIPVYEEMDIIDAFLSIERVRFPNKIIYKVDENYDENDVILPLLVEPIVENCIQHGMKPDQILHIYIDIKENGNYLCFSIKDDGNGMNEEQLKKIRSNDYVSTSSIGFSNVKKRLMLYYNEKLHVISTKGYGTEVSFKVPILKL